jgi:hypothetical protein
MAVDKNTYYNNFNNSTLPSYLAREINEQVAGECDNLADAKGTSGYDDGNCDVFDNDLIPAIQQVYYQIKNGMKNIYANEDSKCDEDNEPTLASILSRLLRFDEAVACILCTYDPQLIAYLKSGTYPQVLMGGGSGSKYPVWQNPSTQPSANSVLPITSDAVYKAIRDAIDSVFHKATDDSSWASAGGGFTYQYYADTPEELYEQYDESSVESDEPIPEEGDLAMVLGGEDGVNQEYKYIEGEWVGLDIIGEPNNFAVIEIEKGTYGDEELYYLHDSAGNISWNILDFNLTGLEDRVAALEEVYQTAVLSYDTTEYLFGVKATLVEAQAVTPTPGKTTVTLVIGA